MCVDASLRRTHQGDSVTGLDREHLWTLWGQERAGRMSGRRMDGGKLTIKIAEV